MSTLAQTTKRPTMALGRWAALPVVLAGTFIVVLDFFIVNVALPAMQREFNAGSAAIEWIVAGYGLAYAALLNPKNRIQLKVTIPEGNRVSQVIALLACLTGYWMLMTLVPVPGAGPGHLDPQNNLSAYVDRLLLSGHMWSQTKTWDPEGTVSTLPAIATALFGILTGHLLRAKREPAERAAWMFTAGNVLIFIGLMLSTWMPINKKIWTTSFSVFMAGLATVCFALCYWLIDVQGWKRFAKPFAIYGMNAIAVYVLSGVVARGLGLIKIGGVTLQKIIYTNVFAPLADPYTASMLYGIVFSFMLFLVAWFMYRRHWFVRF